MESRTLPIRLLAIEHSPNDVERWVKLFRSAGLTHRIQYIDSLSSFESSLDLQPWDIVISVEETPSITGQQLLKTLEYKKQNIPVIIILPKYNPEVATRWLEAGAKDAIPASSEQHILQAICREINALEQRRQLKITRRELTDTNKRCQLLLNNASEAIAYLHYGMHVEANQTYLDLFGYKTADELVGMSLIDMVNSDSRDIIKRHLKEFQKGHLIPEFKCQLMHHEGNLIPASIKFSDAQYDNEPCIQLTIKPISVVRQTANCSDYNCSQEQLLIEAKTKIQTSDAATLIWLQIDNYDAIRKTIDISGFLSIQKDVPEIIQAMMPNALTCRLGEDVFLILDTETALSDIESTLSQLQEGIDNHLFSTENETIHIMNTIGYATTQASDNLEKLISFARTAHGYSEQDGNTRIKQYCQTDDIRMEADDSDIPARIEQALSEETLQLNYQPVISVTGVGDQHHYEVVTRIPDSDNDYIDTKDCMKSAELSELMPLIDRWVLRQCAIDLTRKYKNGELVHLLIPVSQWFIKDSQFASFLISLFKATPTLAEHITLLFDESTALLNLRGLVDLNKEIGSKGVQIAINEFSGDSRAMKLLQHLNIYMVQLNNQFTKILGKDETEHLNTTLNVLSDHNIKCVAVDINNSQAIAHLWQAGVGFAKGDYIGKPSHSMNYEFE